MKVLSIIVPCYNSQDYMEKCIDSLLPGGNDVEILIVNDGSVDRTGAIADGYQMKYPETVRVFHQQNAGHGGAINTGIQQAKGKYIKVVDSDDWVDITAYVKILKTLKGLSISGKDVDMLISNFVYEKDGEKFKKTMKYSKVLPENTVFTWDEVGRFRKGQYLLMHSVIYHAELLYKCDLRLPEHTFYVDNIYVYLPLSYVKTMYYLDVDFYRYFIGRDDQSVNEKIMIGRIDQQLKVNKIMLDCVRLENVINSRQRQYMLNYFEIITVVSSVLLIRDGSVENLEKKNELWAYIKRENPWVYRHLIRSYIGMMSKSTGYLSRNLLMGLYRVSQKLVGFN